MMRTLAVSIGSPSKTIALRALLLAIAMLFVGFLSSASAKDVSTRAEKESSIQPGTYSLVAYGCNAASDPQAVAFLQRDDSPYRVSIVQPRAEYQMAAGLTADEAFKRAENFVTCNPNAIRTDISSIKAPDGTLIGYELTPVLAPLHSGSVDPVDTAYRVKGNDVLAYVTVDPLLQMNEMGGGG
jgi:hypothetical protein